MADYFFDSSALVKRFTQETGSDWTNSLCQLNAKHNIHIAAITGSEVIAALARRDRGNTLGNISITDAVQQFRMEFVARYRVVEIKMDLILQAMDMAERHALRGYDAVQLAAALAINTELQAAYLPTLTLVSADTELNLAAQAENLSVENPNNYS